MFAAFGISAGAKVCSRRASSAALPAKPAAPKKRAVEVSARKLQNSRRVTCASSPRSYGKSFWCSRVASRTSRSSERISLMTLACFSEFIALVRVLDLGVYPRFESGHLNLISPDLPLEDAAAVHLDRVGVGRQHQINFRLDTLIAEDVRVDRLRAAKRNDLFITSERDCTRRAHARAHRL